MSIHAIQSTADLAQMLQGNSRVLIDFWAPWCGPCKQLHPVLEQLARTHPDVKILSVNVDDHPGIAAQYSIRALPSLAFIKDNSVVSIKIGAAPAAILAELLRTQLGA